MIAKTETEHLTCNIAKDDNGRRYWQIWEKEKNDRPIVLFINFEDIRINEDIDDITEYSYFEEVKKIINDLVDDIEANNE